MCATQECRIAPKQMQPVKRLAFHRILEKVEASNVPAMNLNLSRGAATVNPAVLYLVHAGDEGEAFRPSSQHRPGFEGYCQLHLEYMPRVTRSAKQFDRLWLLLKANDQVQG